MDNVTMKEKSADEWNHYYKINLTWFLDLPYNCVTGIRTR